MCSPARAATFNYARDNFLDWKSNRLGESFASFRARALKEEEGDGLPGSPIPWALHLKPDHGFIRETKRSGGTVLKDVASNMLSEDFCVAIVGHKGWSKDPDSTSRYTLAVTFEILGKEIPIYEEIRAAVPTSKRRLRHKRPR
jgi:hypothetical protein